MFPTSLVQYGSPQKAMHHSTKVDIETKRQKGAKIVPVYADEQITMGSTELLDVLLPPRAVEEDGQFWYQCVSRTPGTPSDLLRLQEQLDAELLRKGAREIGICPTRSELYTQCFEELIRQEVVACPERGRLLRMVQLEAKLSLSSARSCYESALAYGIKKKLMSSKEVSRLTEEVTKLLSKLSQMETVQQNLELQVPKLKDVGEAREKEIQQNFENEEAKIRKENEVLVAEMMEFIEVSIEEEKQL
ncbi:33 kDa inner dynein arm light chain, axonemal-like [Argiope bruennichi]|uniref:28 kDa inner dynein arm light chain like protein n=1 Tax=Argiope bruennichi TaxID=94029 RepID=A0A8T0FZ14_ARGBR|nr:33 kDa inner dynein arm light chain, axonemal-like [Argiope bruennichi]KAF8794113.1 28 kDa inner dynein arm light chain like protein [Argiope bruennichi]